MDLASYRSAGTYSCEVAARFFGKFVFPCSIMQVIKSFKCL